MKRFSVIALAVAAVMLFAIPAMAVDLDFSGHYRARGWYNDNTDLNDNTGASDAQMDQRFRLQTVFKVHEDLSVTTRFDTVDYQVWGQNRGSTDTTNDMNWDRAFLTAKFDMFTLYVGRMGGGTAFTDFVDTVRNADRIKFSMKPTDEFTLVGFYEKLTEADYNAAAADRDMDEYALLGLYKQEAFEVGAILAFLRNSDGANLRTDERYIFNPYFKALIGPVTLVGEGQMDWGDRDYWAAGTVDPDLEGFAVNLEASMDVGPANVMVGWAHVDGDDPNDNDDATFTTAGGEWTPFLILTEGDIDDALLGGAGNLQSASQDWGFDLYYAKATFSPMENLELFGILGFATADEERAYVDSATQEDDIGWEFDIGATWQIMDNLAYSIIVAYFDAGDFFKGGVSTSQVDDSTYTVFNELKVTF